MARDIASITLFIAQKWLYSESGSVTTIASIDRRKSSSSGPVSQPRKETTPSSPSRVASARTPSRKGPSPATLTRSESTPARRAMTTASSRSSSPSWEPMTPR